MTRLGSRGEGRIGCILWMAVLAIGIFIAVKAVPVKLTDVEFADFIEEQAQFSGRATAEVLRNRILKKARELEIPLKKTNLKVEKSTRRVRIRATYKVTLDFRVYQYEWVFEHDLDRPIFLV